MKYRWVQAGMLLMVTMVAGPVQQGKGQAPLTQISLPGENSSTARRLAAIDRLIAEEKWSEAVEETLRALNEAGDDLVPIDGRHAVQARRLCHIRLAGLPENALKIYRERVDGQVKKWWEQGEPKNDVALLRQIVDEAFCSTFADRALDLLGDLAFERGDFAEAEHWWGLLVLPLSKTVLSQSGSLKPKPLDLKFPHPKVDVARVHAKQILVQLFLGKRAEMDGELQAFRSLHPEAEGSFAGRIGKFADILQSLKQEPGYCDFPINHPSWPTFAGHPSRQFLVPKAPSLYLVETAVIPLDHPPAAKKTPRKSLAPLQENQTLVYYPVIDGGQVVLANGYGVISYDARSGNVVGHYELAEDVQQTGGDIEVETTGGFCHSLTVTGDSIFVRLGKPAVADDKVQERNWGTCFLVCLDRKPGKGGILQRRWWVKAQGEGKDRMSFEGAPLVVDGRVYITRIRFTGALVSTAIECYNGASGYRFWRQEVSEIRELADGQPRNHHHLLTQAGPNVVYCSHSGAVIAVDALTGRRVWAVRYPSRGIRTADGSLSPRNLAPCVFADHQIFIAPADYERIFCLEAATGELRWQGPPLEVVHLLGMAKGKLIFSTGPSTAAIFSPQSFYGIQALDAETGKLLRGWIQPADGTRLATFGRGFLTGDKVFWPTEHGLRILKTEDGQPDWDDYPLNVRLGNRPGNMAFGEGILALAGATHLRIFVPAPPGLGQVLRKSIDQLKSSLPAIQEEVQRQPRIWAGAPKGYRGGKLWNDDFGTRAGKNRPHIAVPLEASWEINLEQNEHMLIPGEETCQCQDGNEVFFGRGKELVCRDVLTRTTRWQQLLPGSAQWIGRHADCVLAAGFWGMQCLTLAEGKIHWQFVVPGEKGDFFFAEPRERRFASPRLAGWRIFFLSQEKRLFALDLETGRCLWTISAPAADMHLPHPAGRFLPFFYAGTQRVIVQTTTGKTLILQSNTG
ncbi:MAG TPA: PQQ-binding-like beta-propeller repeat protein, partial [Gemmataceae bacterium]|nr:PQQ-binding-like beta-propeller repeat protein [Gemmataceae bacterium]